jgi:hypothetical protein
MHQPSTSDGVRSKQYKLRAAYTSALEVAATTRHQEPLTSCIQCQSCRVVASPTNTASTATNHTRHMDPYQEQKHQTPTTTSYLPISTSPQARTHHARTYNNAQPCEHERTTHAHRTSHPTATHSEHPHQHHPSFTIHSGVQLTQPQHKQTTLTHCHPRASLQQCRQQPAQQTQPHNRRHRTSFRSTRYAP